MSREVRGWHLHTRTDLTFRELARRVNPKLAGWINYYGRFRPWELTPLLTRINCPSPRSVESVIAGKLGFMGSKQRTYTPEFREGAVRIVIETGRPIPEVAEELGVHSGTLHS
ncbi:transposase [Streptomyces sp. NBC_00237]|uniref:group II intron maturase-specific domain-containing protein n=1 Tax=Streptomyces sp. NBC_00237 TaxID=2975687 RepID=UPI0022525BDF|nr:group II intron maturase-specific domain-containing protein [Streptomyces sp. NBC_00237]MCX5205836.1 transposase [Streptomyces sp. NBC_00237]